jgi:hypothetical protein
MAVTFDTRPTAIGDMIMVTGKYEANDTTIDLSGFFGPNSVEFFSITPTATLATTTVELSIEETPTAVTATYPDTFQLVDATCIVTLYGGTAAGGSQEPGNFMAIGRRGL